MATATAVPKTKIGGGSWLLEDRSPDDIFTPEDFTDEHQQIAQTTEEFAIKEIVANNEKIEHKEWAVTRELLRKASEIGIATVDVPEQYSGAGMDKNSSPTIPHPTPQPGSLFLSFVRHRGNRHPPIS